MIEPLGKIDSQKILQGHHFGRLGCCIKGEPYVLPINYLFEGEDIYVHSLPGLKIQVLRESPQVCLQVDEVEDDYNWRSAIAFGEYEEIAEPAERERWMTAFYRQFPHLTPVESRMTKGKDEVIVFRIHVDRITGVGEHWQ